MQFNLVSFTLYIQVVGWWIWMIYLNPVFWWALVQKVLPRIPDTLGNFRTSCGTPSSWSAHLERASIWACYKLIPISWCRAIYGLVASQIGDFDNDMTLTTGGTSNPADFIRTSYGYEHNYLGKTIHWNTVLLLVSHSEGLFLPMRQSCCNACFAFFGCGCGCGCAFEFDWAKGT